MAAPLGQNSHLLPPAVKEIVTKARTTWLKNDEVLKLLLHYKALDLPIGREAPNCPGGGLLFLFNRKAVRFFRKDGHEWRKKADGKTVRETHEKLKIGNKEVLNCYYAHSEAQEALQRRCYWLLEGNGDIVLVHYLSLHPSVHMSVPASTTMTDKSDDQPSQAGMDLLGQCSSRLYTGNCMDRASSTPVESTNGCLPMSTMTTAKSLDRQSSLGPLHAAPSFSAGTVQTGSTLEGPAGSSDSAQWHAGPSPQPGQQQSNGAAPGHLDSAMSHRRFLKRSLSGGSQGSDGSGHLPSSRPQLDLSQVQSEHEAHARAWEVLKRKEREATEPTDDTLKPAPSLTRVDSDTLKVAPSLSGATGGFSSEMSRHQLPGKASKLLAKSGLRCTVASPFFAAAYFDHAVVGKPSNLVEEVFDRQARPSAMSWNEASHNRSGILASPSMQAPTDYDVFNSERIKRYRSGDVTGSNHSFVPLMDVSDLSAQDVTSPQALPQRDGNQPNVSLMADTPPGLEPSQGIFFQSTGPKANWLLDSTELSSDVQPGGIDPIYPLERRLSHEGVDKWPMQHPPDCVQTERLHKDLDMLLPMDLDWAIDLSSHDSEDLRRCRAS